MGDTNPHGRQLSRGDLVALSDHIRGRIARQIPVEELAAVVGMSESCFARLFRQTTGKTPHCFVLEQRIEAAKVLLRSAPAGSIGGIAHRTGFSDQAHLTRTFRRVTGQTPREFCAAHGCQRA